MPPTSAKHNRLLLVQQQLHPSANTNLKTAVHQGQTYRINLTHDLGLLTYDLDLQPLQSMVTNYSHAKVQDQRSVGSENSVNKWTDR